MFTQDQIMHLFEDRKVMMDGHFLLSSGLHSDRYAQCARIFEYPEVAKMICGDLVEKLAGTDIDMVMGPAVGGIIMAYEIARELDVPNVFAERVDGKMTLRRGFEVPKGSKVLLVEDVVTTGGSVNELFEIVEAAGATVSAVACILDRSNGDAHFKVPFVSELAVKVLTYEAGECPMCAEGSVPEEPGSRRLNKS